MRIWAHFKTITRHRWAVRRLCFKVGLYWQGLTHDLSKYSPQEFLPGCRYYQGFRSPNDQERQETGSSRAGIISSIGSIIPGGMTPPRRRMKSGVFRRWRCL